MQTELENITQQVNALQENTDLITQDIVRIMPTIVSLLSESEKNMKKLHEMRSGDQETMIQIKGYIKRENDIISKIIRDYGSLQNVAHEIATTTQQELSLLTKKESEIVSKIAEIPDQVKVKHLYGIDLKSTPIIIIMMILSLFIALGVGILFEKSKRLEEGKSYEMRYRMLKLEFPKITSYTDSIYVNDPDKFQELVAKREEEKILRLNMQHKQQEINDLENSK